MLPSRFSEGRSERVAEAAAEFVQQKADAIVTYGAAALTFKRATASIPIVLAVANDPVGIGLVASLSRPGGNVTGLSLQATDAVGKRLELLREVVPGLRRLAILFDAGYPASRAGNGRSSGWRSKRRPRGRGSWDPAPRGYCALVRFSERPRGCTLRRGKYSDFDQ